MNVNQYIEYIIYFVLVFFIIVLAVGIMYALFLAVQSWEKQRAQEKAWTVNDGIWRAVENVNTGTH